MKPAPKVGQAAASDQGYREIEVTVNPKKSFSKIRPASADAVCLADVGGCR